LFFRVFAGNRQDDLQTFLRLFNNCVKNNVEKSEIGFITLVKIRRCSSLHTGQCARMLGMLFTSVELKLRIDKLLVERGLVASRERAQAMILAGRVLVNEQKVEKSGATVDAGSAVRLLGEDLKYVSRGGVKLEAALTRWEICLSGRTCMDVGASTGGFTDCMLQNGAAHVIAVDTGYGQIAARLRSDPRVTLLEKTNARHLTRKQLQEAGAPGSVSFIAIDVSFISVTLLLPAVFAAGLKETSASLREMVVLIKPQFEAGRDAVGKGGIVRDEHAQQRSIVKVREAVEKLHGLGIEVIESPIRGMEGNREFLLHAQF
jgi:23S rRNA (cytidine1920-2'-O)/16S rRNA (cytidine1409-2'-O)-methyltransferase